MSEKKTPESAQPSPDSQSSTDGDATDIPVTIPQQAPDVASPHPEEAKKSKDKMIKVLRSHIEGLEKKASERDFYLDHLQRLQAEFDNFRKRNAKEREEFRKSVLEEFLLELLHVGDNFERAIDSFKSVSDVSQVKSGIEMICKQFKDILASRGIKEIPSLGQSFDPLCHDAVHYEDRDDMPPQSIIKEFAKGYSLNGKMIRPSKVSVSREKPTCESGQTPTELS